MLGTDYMNLDNHGLMWGRECKRRRIHERAAEGRHLISYLYKNSSIRQLCFSCMCQPSASKIAVCIIILISLWADVVLCLPSPFLP